MRGKSERKKREKSSVSCWHGESRKQRILSFILCAVLVAGSCMPEYGMSVHAAEILPSSAGDDSSVEESNEERAELPLELNQNVILSDDKASDAATEKSLTVTLSKTEYEAGSEIKPEDLTVEYHGADGEVTVLSYKNDDKNDSTGGDTSGDTSGDTGDDTSGDTSDDSVTGYTMSGADTNTLGVKTLTVSYNDGTDTLTATADYTVYGVLTDAMVTMPNQEYIYNRAEQKPEPVVKYADDVTLLPEEDYSVAYTDNIDAGEAALTISGKGVYRGSVTKKFVIQKATFDVVELSCEASCWKAAQGYLDLCGYFSVEAASDGGGFTGRLIGEIEEYDNVEDGGGDVLAEQPYIDEAGLLRYSTKAGTVGDSVMIPVIVSFGKNYNDGVIHFTISLQDDGSASGTYGGVTWKIDANGKLTVEGTGEFSASKGWYRAPWYDYRDRIKSAEIRVTGMRNAAYMFYQCRNLTSVDLSGLDKSSVTNMQSMFEYCRSLTSLDLSGLDASGVTDMSNMFAHCGSLTSVNLSGFDTGSVTNMQSMFEYCSSLTGLNVSGFDTGSVTNMESMFAYCSSLTSLDLSGFDTGSVTNMEHMFAYCSSLMSLNVSKFDTGSVTNMQSMFSGCTELASLDLSNFDMGSVTEVKTMFSGCQGLTSLKLGNFDTGKVTDMYGMFYNCDSLTSLDLSSFDTGKVTDMSSMFWQCGSLTSLDLSNFDTCNVTNMYAMFYECGSLTSLDLSSFDMGSVTKANNMFLHCSSLSTLYAPYNITADAAPDLPVMQNGNDKWYDSEQKEYTELPVGLDYSIALAKNKTPDATEKRLSVILSKSAYEQGSVIQPEDLTVQYRGTDGRTIRLPMKAGNNAFGYTLSGADTSSPAVGTLTVSYDDGTDTLTKTVNYMVYGVLTDSMVSMPDKEYIYNREEQRPEPVVSYTGDAALKQGEDYSVSYADNIDAGEAAVSVSGKGLYRGTVTKKFMIQKATFGEVDLSCEESCWKSAQGFLDLGGYFAVEAASDGGGFAGRSIGEIIEYNTVSGRAVLSEPPSIDADGILRYSTIEGTAGDSVLIPVIVSFGKNYNDAVINVTIAFLYDEGEVSGAYEGITWTITSSGKLTVKGTGEFSDSKGWDRAPWYNYRKSITSAEVNVTGMKNASDMFIDCWYLKSVDLSGFDTSSVTNMNGMFGNCSSLKSVDLSGLDTSSVTNMGYLFGGCSSLTSVDLSGLDTSSVIYMNEMFIRCESLRSVNLRGFNQR
ncbi:MAG: BspA family leucine-rich repeat surface protein [Butyrivibrio sp.]|nr:BspA family leucine-rich repeat surface protein [Muribaculum sp.]MCM1552891.1 BspA family leucine-rich repeat surface protein [Butyrivibrio sp.]